MSLVGRAEPFRNGDGEDVLDSLSVDAHSEPGERVGLYGRGRLELGFEDDGAFGQPDDDVWAFAGVECLGGG